MSGNFQISQNNLDNDTHLKILDTYLVCMLEVYLQENLSRIRLKNRVKILKYALWTEIFNKGKVSEILLLWIPFVDY